MCVRCAIAPCTSTMLTNANRIVGGFGDQSINSNIMQCQCFSWVCKRNLQMDLKAVKRIKQILRLMMKRNSVGEKQDGESKIDPDCTNLKRLQDWHMRSSKVHHKKLDFTPKRLKKLNDRIDKQFWKA